MLCGLFIFLGCRRPCTLIINLFFGALVKACFVSLIAVKTKISRACNALAQFPRSAEKRAEKTLITRVKFHPLLIFRINSDTQVHIFYSWLIIARSTIAPFTDVPPLEIATQKPYCAIVDLDGSPRTVPCFFIR